MFVEEQAQDTLYDGAHLRRRRIASGTAAGGLLMAITIGTAIVHYKLVIGLLPRELAGLWLLFWSLGSYLAFFDLGIGPTLSREISFLAGKADRSSEVADLAKTCLRIYSVVSFLLLGFALLAGWLLLPTLNLQSIAPRDALIVWGLFTGGACVNLLNNLSFSILTGEGEVAIERLTRAFGMLCWLFLSTYTLTAGYGLIGVALAWLVNACVVRVLSITVVKYKFHDLRISQGRWRADLARRIASPSARWASIQLGALLILQTANLLIAWNLGPSAIPSYEAAARVIMAAGTIALLSTNASIPYYSRAFVTDDLASLRDLLYRNVQHGLLAMAATISVLCAFAPELFFTWLGQGNFVGYPVLIVMACMMTLETHHVAHASQYMASGRIPFVRIAVVAGILNLVISLILVRWLGLLGIALGTMIAQMLTNNWYVPHANLRRLRIETIDYLRFILPRLFGLIALFGMTAGAVSMLTLGYHPLMRLSAGTIASACLSFILYRRLEHPKMSLAK